VLETCQVPNVRDHRDGHGALHPTQGLESVHHRMQAPRFDLLAEFLVQTPEALRVFRDGPDLFLKDDLLRRGGTDDFREPPEVSRAPIGPARRADILSEQEGFEPECGVFEIADHIFARPCEIPDCFVVHFGDIHRREVPRAGQSGQLDRITAVRLDPLPRLLGHQRRGHDPAVIAFLLQRALEPRAARPRFGEKDEVLGLRWHLADEGLAITLAGADRPHVGDLSTMIVRHVGDRNGLFVDIHADKECARLGHG